KSRDRNDDVERRIHEASRNRARRGATDAGKIRSARHRSAALRQRQPHTVAVLQAGPTAVDRLHWAKNIGAAAKRDSHRNERNERKEWGHNEGNGEAIL